MFAIRKSSSELNDTSEPRWHFVSALSLEAHTEWGLYKILEYMGLHEILPPGAGQNRAKLRKMPPGLRHRLRRNRHRHLHLLETRWSSLRQGKKVICLSECTRAMDTNEDWAEKKEQEKNDRYSSQLGFINHLSNWEKSGWKASQLNFTTVVRGSLHTHQFLTGLESLGVKNKNTREAIRNRTVQKPSLCLIWSSSSFSSH